MRKLLLFFLFSVCLSAQKIESIELKQSIKDKKSLTKSLTLIDNRTDKEIGSMSFKGQTIGVKFLHENLSDYIPVWFSNDNKVKGNNDIILLLEELKVDNDNDKTAKVRIKISSFIKRNDKFYFLNRLENVFVSDPKFTPNVPKNVVSNISSAFSAFIKESYISLPISVQIHESELSNYEKYLNKNYLAFNNTVLKDGCYKDFRSFSAQKTEFGYYAEKNKKGKVVRIKNKEDLVANEDIFVFVDEGKAYKVTPVGFLEMLKDDKGFYVEANKSELYGATGNNGEVIGAMMGGLVGGLIGAAIDFGSNSRRSGTNTSGMPHVYLDSLTGAYVFEN